MHQFKEKKVLTARRVKRSEVHAERLQILDATIQNLFTMASCRRGFVRPCFNPLTPNDHYSDRTATLTSKRCILYIYSTNIGTEYFKHGIYSPFFLFKMQFVS